MGWFIVLGHRARFNSRGAVQLFGRLVGLRWAGLWRMCRVVITFGRLNRRRSLSLSAMGLCPMWVLLMTALLYLCSRMSGRANEPVLTI